MVLCLLACSSLSLQAADIEQNALQWSGFFTTGVNWTDSSVPYNTVVTKNPKVVPNTLLGLNISKPLSAHMTLGGQLLAQGANADSALKADWAYVNYQPNDNVSFTIGQQKIPLWLMAEYANVGRAYPWTNPPEEVYSLFNIQSFAGASSRFQYMFSHLVVALEPYTGTTVVETSPSAPTSSSKVSAKDMFGANLEIKASDFLKLRAAFNRAKWNLNLSPTISLGEHEFQVVDYSLTAHFKDFNFISEYAQTTDLDQGYYTNLSNQENATAAQYAKAGNVIAAAAEAQQAALDGLKIGGAKAYYLTMVYNFKILSGYASYAHVVRPENLGITQNQSSTTVGIGYDVSPDSVIKVEVKHIMPSGLGLFTPSSTQTVADVKKSDVFTINYNCVF